MGDEHYKEVTLSKGSGDYGFTLKGSAPVVIFEVAPGGLADKAAILPGDQILSINGTDVSNFSHEAVVMLLRQAGSSLTLGLQNGDLFDETFSDSEEEPTPTEGRSGPEGEPAPKPETDIVSPLSVEEVKAFAAFSSLELLLASPPHLATFLHFVFSNGVSEDEMLFYLHASWLINSTTLDKNAARQLFEDFISINAPIKIEGVPAEVLFDLETVLNDKNMELSSLKAVMLRARVVVEEAVSSSLMQFEEFVRLGLGHVYGAPLLVDCPPSEEGRVVYEMLHPHFEDVHAEIVNGKSNEMIHRNEIIEETLRKLMDTAGLNTSSLLSSQGSINKRPSYVSGKLDRNDSTFFNKQHKIHLHAGHHFVTTSYQQPTFCGYCKALLWGAYSQGWTCLDCGFNVHKKNDKTGHKMCHTMLREQCPGYKIPKQRSLFGFSSKRGKNRSVKENGDESPKKSPFTERKERDGQEEDAKSGNEGEDPKEKEDGPPQSNSASFKRNKDKEKAVPPQPAVHVHKPVELADDPMTAEPQLWQDTVPDKKVLKKLSKKELARQEAIYELIQTEKGYLRHLNIIQNVFRQPLIDEGMFRKDQLSLLFANVDTLVVMNSSLLGTLRQRQAEAGPEPIVNIADAFLQGFEKIVPLEYATFCSNQTPSMNFFNEKLRGYSAFATCIKVSESHPSCGRLIFSDFIAKPLQRLTKYPLLLREILKNTEKKDSEEYVGLEKAIEKTSSLLKEVEHSVRESENRVRLKEINDKLDRTTLSAEDLATVRALHQGSRKLLYEEGVQIKLQDRHVDIYAILLTDLLLLVQPKDDKYLLKMPGRESKKKSPVVILPFLMVRAVATDHKAFFLIYNQHASSAGPQMYELIAASKTKAKEWIERLNKAIEEFKKENPQWEVLSKQQAQPPETLLPEADKAEDENSDEEENEITETCLLDQIRDHASEISRLVKQLEKLHGPPSSSSSESHRFSRRTLRPGSKNQSFSKSSGLSDSDLAEGDPLQQPPPEKEYESVPLELARAYAEIADLKLKIAEMLAGGSLHEGEPSIGGGDRPGEGVLSDEAVSPQSVSLLERLDTQESFI